MCNKWMLLSLFPLCMTAIPTQADELILKNEQIIEGEAVLEGKIWTIITKDGETLTFDRSEVKRHIFESRVTPLEAVAMMKELVRLVEPVLFAPEPDQNIWSRAITEHSGRYRYRSRTHTVFLRDRIRVTSGQGQYEQARGGTARHSQSDAESHARTESKTLRDKGIDAVFVDEWARYIAYFERLEEDLLYEELTKRRKYSGSLAEFARWPPKGYEQQAEALKKALEAIDESIELAKTTQRLVRAIPIKQRKLEAAVTKAENRVARAKDRLESAAQNQKRYRSKDVGTAESSLRRARARLQNDFPKATRVAEQKINDFARRREVTIGAVVRAAEELGAVYTEQPADNLDVPGAETFPLAKAIEEGLQQIDRHRQQSQELAPLGLETLRARTRANIREIFTGRKFVMRLFVKTNGHSPEAGYHLVAEDRAEGQGESHIKTMLHFDESLLNDLAMCKTDAGVILEASVQSIEVSPTLEALESQGVEPVFVVKGTVVAVESGCG